MGESDEDKVWLTYGPDFDEGDIISRMRLPEDAIRVSLQLDGSRVPGDEDQMYEVWTIDR